MTDSSNVLTPKPKAEPSTIAPTPRETVGDAVDIGEIQVKQYFDIDYADDSQSKNVEVIKNWAREKGFNDKETLRFELKKLEVKLGAPDLGEKRTAKIARYLELDRRLGDTLKEMELFDRK